MRKDDFVSFDTGLHRDGLLVTLPLLSEGDVLEISARCHTEGYIKVEVVDQTTSYCPAARPELAGDTIYLWKTEKPFR